MSIIDTEICGYWCNLRMTEKKILMGKRLVADSMLGEMAAMD